MIIHYFKIAIRNLLKDRVYSVINLAGLSIAIACCFLTVFWIKFELSYEDCHPKAGRIYKVLEIEKRADGLYQSEQLKRGIAHQLMEAFPEIESYTVVNHWKRSFSYEENEGIMVNFVESTPAYLDLFSYEYMQGSKESVLNNRGIIISEETAMKFFGNESAIGKSLTLFGDSYTVHAVVRIPQNTHLNFDILDPFSDRDSGIQYILIKENVRFSKESQQRMSDYLNTAHIRAYEITRQGRIEGIKNDLASGKRTEEDARQYIESLQKITLSQTENTLVFLPVKSVHLHSPKNNSSIQTFGDLKRLYLYSLITFLIIIVAVINYINTSTARTMSRMKEVGVRKITGSTRKQLILRFLSDAFILSAVSVVIAMMIAKVLFSDFSILMGNEIAFRFDIHNILIAIVVCLFITILSGGYAAFYLSSLNPVVILQGGFRPNSKDSLRKVLIGLQFFLSIGIMISTLTIYRQINYMFTTDTGVDRKNILISYTKYWEHSDDFIKAIKNENPNIIDASFAFVTPHNATYNYTGVSWLGSPEEVKRIEIAKIYCDHHYANTFGLKMISGEFIQSGNENHIVINEAFQKMMGVENPIGMTLYPENVQIIGVIKDFNFKPLKEPVTPLIICYNPPAHTTLYVKITGNKKETINYIRKKYNEMGGYLQKTIPFNYVTVEDDFKSMYKSELRTMKMLTIFSVLSLFLSVLGVFGMVLYMIKTRTKEIAIRRINGAETKDIIFLFLVNFVKIIGFSTVISIPVCFFILQRWIQTYAFRTSLSGWIFILVPAVVMLITAVEISLQIFFTARQNPAKMVQRTL